MYSFILRFIFGVLALAGVVRTVKVFKEPKEVRDQRLLSFFYFFLFLALHQLAWSVPFTAFKSSSALPFWLYELGIAFYFLLLFFSLKMFSLVSANNKFFNTNVLGKLTLTAGALVAITQFFWFTPPVIEKGVVIWQTDVYTSLINGLFGFLTAVVWVFMFYKNIPQRNKAKTVFLCLGSLFLGLSCLVFFVFKTPLASLLAFAFIFLGLICAMASFYWVKGEKQPA